MATTIELPNNDRATIHPYDASKIREALKALAKQNIHISMGDSNLLNSIEFQIASGKSILKAYEVKQDDGTFKELSELEKAKLINERPKIVNYLVKKAQELAAAEDKEFDLDSFSS